MILPGGQDQLHSKYDHVAGSTIRQPERASLASRPSLYLTLPSYETSQEQAAQLSAIQSAQSTDSLLWKDPKPAWKRKIIFSPRVLKLALISLVVYVVLTVAIGVPFIVKVGIPSFSFSYSLFVLINVDLIDYTEPAKQQPLIESWAPSLPLPGWCRSWLHRLCLPLRL
jgi:hypothetical protein